MSAKTVYRFRLMAPETRGGEPVMQARTATVDEAMALMRKLRDSFEGPCFVIDENGFRYVSFGNGYRAISL